VTIVELDNLQSELAQAKLEQAAASPAQVLLKTRLASALPLQSML
jgi:hypothetical protein